MPMRQVTKKGNTSRAQVAQTINMTPIQQKDVTSASYLKIRIPLVGRLTLQILVSLKVTMSLKLRRVTKKTLYDNNYHSGKNRRF